MCDSESEFVGDGSLEIGMLPPISPQSPWDDYSVSVFPKLGDFLLPPPAVPVSPALPRCLSLERSNSEPPKVQCVATRDGRLMNVTRWCMNHCAPSGRVTVCRAMRGMCVNHCRPGLSVFTLCVAPGKPPIRTNSI
jgi:hypothetical protein